jgi:PD-(D/E)XK nuclease superfamily
LDLLDLIRNKITALPDGQHQIGLLSVLRHIEAAYRHLARGQSTDDEGAFTDAIYRTNQAFEGSIKEAFRVLTDKDPQRKSPHEIEKYLEDEGVFRNRILSQFTNYRQEWRNPSTHDYNLSFDEDEAFLAIISVSAFVKLLVDQIAERLSYKAARKDFEHSNPETKSEISPKQDLVDKISVLFGDFVHHYAIKNASVPIESEAQLMGALAGFLSTVAPDLMVTTGRIIRASKHHYVDMIIERDGEEVIVELKRGQSENLVDQGLQQLMTYMTAAHTEKGILFMYSSSATDYAVEKREDVEGSIREVRVIRPKR